MIKILMHGCNGRMGQMISGLVRDEEEMMIAAGVDTYQGVSNEYPVFGSIDACDDDVDVVIDFSNAAAADAVMEYCAKRQIPLVFCTTGLSEEQLQKLEDTAKQTAVLKSANMSLGINLLLKLLKDAAKVLAPAGYDIEILEKHHNQKIDAPSGTAELLYEVMAEEIDGVEACYDRSSRHEKRKKEEIGIQSLRGGTIFGEHTIMFAGVDEIIEIKHTALSKEVFVQGAISAAYALNDKDNGLFTLKSLY